MAETPPILPPSASGAVKSGTPQVNNQGRNPPPLPELPPGTSLNGTVTNIDTKGNPQVITDALKLVLRTEYPLQKGNYLTMRLEGGLKQDVLPQVRITSVDGKPIPVPNAPQSGAPTVPTNPNVQTPSLAGELAKPVGTLIDAVSRPLEEIGKPPVQAQQAKDAPVAREVATQVNVRGDQIPRLPAQLLKLAVTPQAPQQLLTNVQKAVAELPPQVLAQQQGAVPSGKAPAAPQINAANIAEWVKPGALVQFRLTQLVLPNATTQAAAQPQASLSTSPAPNASPSTPSANQAATTASPTSLPTPPTNPAGYSTYAKAVPPSGTIERGVAPSNPTSPQQQASTQPPPTAAPPASSASPSPTQAAPTVNTAISQDQVTQILQQATSQGLPKGQMAAVVLGQERSGALVVQTQLGAFSLPSSAVSSTITPNLPQGVTTIPAGTVLHLEADAVKLTQAMQPRGLPPVMANSGAFTASSQLTAEWSAMQELVGFINTLPASAAADAMARIAPQVGQNMTAGLVFFVALIRQGGGIADWLGQDLLGRMQAAGKQDLIERLSSDLAALRTVWTESASAQTQQLSPNWQAFFLPVLVEKDLNLAKLYVKREEEENKKKGGGGTRFVIELDLSNLGEMQLDGLVKKREMQSYFDLVIRTLSDLPDQIQNDMIHIFEGAQEAAGFKGQIYFRTEVEFPVKPLEEIGKAADSEGDHGSIIA